VYLGGVFGGGVGNGNWYFPRQEYQLTIEFSCDPGRVEELTKATWAVIHELKEKPVEAKYITNIQEINRRDREVSVLSNGFWQGVLLSVLEKNENPLDILSWDERNNSLSPEVLQAAAQQFLKEDSRAEAILLPEAGVQSPDAPSPGLQ
jgi:zinc protease